MVQAVWNLVYVQGPAPSALFHSKEHRHASSEHWNRVKGLFGEGKKKCHTHTSKWKIIKDLTIKRTLDLEFWWHSSALSALDIKHCRSTPPKNNEMKGLESSSLTEDQADHKAEIRLQPNLPVSTGTWAHCSSSGISKLLEQGPFLYSS